MYYIIFKKQKQVVTVKKSNRLITNLTSALKGKNYNSSATNTANPLAGLLQAKMGSSGYSLYDPAEFGVISDWNKAVQDGIEITDEWRNNFLATNKAILDANPQLKKTIDEVTTATKKQEIQVNSAGQGWAVYGSGIKGIITTIKTFAVSMAPALLQMAAITAAVTLLVKVFQWLKEHIPTDSNLRSWAEESASALADTQSELQSLNDELQTTQDRIDELNAKDHLTLTEQDELDRLVETNAQLERQIWLQEQLEKEQKKEAAEDAVKALHTYDETQFERGRASRTVTVAEQLQGFVSDYNASGAELKTADSTEAADKLKESMSDTKSEWIELATIAQGYVDTARENWNALSVEDQEYIESLEAALEQGYFAFGQLSLNDVLQDKVGETAFAEYEAKIKELANTGGKVGDDLTKVFGKDVADALTELGFTADDINEHIRAIANIGDIIDTNATDAEKIKIEEIVNDEDFKITADNIKKQFSDKFIQMLEDCGIAVDDFCKYLQQMRDGLEQISIGNATGELKTAEEGIDAIGEAINEFRDNEGKVDAKTLDGLVESLSAISDTTEFEHFIHVLGNAGSSTAELNAALDDLIDKYFDTQIALGELTDENIDLYTAQLKQMGVVNAESLVRVKLAKNILSDANATEEAKQKAYALVAALDAEEAGLYNTAASALTAEQNLKLFKIQVELVKSNGDFRSVILNDASAIISLGQAAGEQAAVLVKYAQALLTIQQMSQKFGSLKSRRSKASNILNDKVENWETEARNELNSLLDGINSDVDLTVAPSDKSSKGDTQAEKNKDAYDAAKKKLDHQLEMNQISYDTYYKKLIALGNKYLKKEKDNAADLREHYESLAEARRDAFEDAKDDLDLKLENGTITIEKYYTEVEKLMKKWYKGRKSNADDYAQAEIDLQKQISDAWSDRISEQETLFDRLTLEKVWPEGKSELDYWLDQMEDLQKQYRKGMWKDKEAYLKVYYEILEKIQSAEKELAQKQLDEVTEKIEAIDDLVELTSKMLKQRIEDEIDALEDLKDAYSDIVDLKKQSLDLTKEEAEYNKEIAELNEDLTDLQAQAELLKLDTSRAGRAKYADVMSQIREKQDEIAEKQSDHTYDATVDALDAADEAYQEFIQNKIDALNEMMENQGEWLRYVYSYIESTKPSQLLSELKAYNYKYGDGINQTVDKIWDKYEKYADAVYGNSGYLVQILDELRNLELKYSKEVEEAESASDDPYPSDNAASSIKKAVKHANLTSNTDAQNQALARQVEAEYGGSWWYDPKNQNIYSNDYDNKYLVSAAAYPIIKKMKSINSNSSLSKSERKKQLETQLGYLTTYYGYGNAHLVEAKNGKYNLYKTKGKESKWQIFHEGIGAGYAGSDYVPTAKQNELLALLQKGELIFNKENQSNLLSTLQSVDNFQKAFKGITGNSINQSNYNNAPVSVGGVTIQIYGNATQDTVQALRREAENISNMTMDKLHSAMQQKGYTSGAARGTFKR